MLLLVMLLNLGAAQPALAVEDGPVDFQDMAYEPLDMADFNRRVDVLREISAQAINQNAVLTAYGGLERLYACLLYTSRCV